MPYTRDKPSKYNLKIKKSKIHGYGVFTLKPIKKGEMICPYSHSNSDIMKWADFIKKYRNDFRYTYPLKGWFKKKETWRIINVKNNRNIVSYINDNSPNHNTCLKNKKLYALKDIKQNTELTLSYPHYCVKKKI